MKPSAVTRRQSARTAVTTHAFVHCRGRFQHTKVIDYSPGGVQLGGTFGLNRTDPVEVELMSGTRLAGRVAWSVGERSGITFSESLQETHPAMVELARRAVATPGKLHR